MPAKPPISPLLARLTGVYLLVALGLPLLRWAHGWPVAAASWWWVTAPLWLPWALSVLGWLGYLVRRRPR